MSGANRPKVRASGLFFDERGVLLRRHKGHNFYTLLGGSWESGETLEEAVEREFWEETRIRVHVSHLLFLGELRTKDEQVLDVIFHVSGADQQEPVQETSGSLDELCFIPIHRLTRTRVEPREFWRIWIPRLMKHRDEESFVYGGVYPGH
jgi:ADP-ribose pyrophosphatase YjhB (NUDIX family)